MDRNSETPRRRILEHTGASAAMGTLTNRDPTGRRLQRRGVFPHGYSDFYYYGYGYPFPPEDKFIGIIPWAMRILRFLAIGFLMLTSSVMMYGILYWAVMPGHYASRPLFFDYTGTAAYPHIDAIIQTEKEATEGDNQVKALEAHGKPLKTNKWWKKWRKDRATQTALSSSAIYNSEEDTDFTPWATVDLFSKEQAVTIGETMNSELLPPQARRDRVLKPHQVYYVEVLLTLPESEHNRISGMFGVAVDLFSYSEENTNSIFLASSVRPARLRHESSWVGVARKLFWLLPLVFGGMEESQVVVIPSFRHILESKDFPLRHVVVRLVGQPPTWNWHSSNPENSQRFPIEVVKAEVRIGKELNEWQEVLKGWFYTCYAIGTIVLFGMHIMTYILIQYYRQDTADEFEPYIDPSCDFSLDSDDDGNDGPEGTSNEDNHNNHTDGTSNNTASDFNSSHRPGDASGPRDDGSEEQYYNASDDNSDEWETLDNTGTETLQQTETSTEPLEHLNQ